MRSEDSTHPTVTPLSEVENAPPLTRIGSDFPELGMVQVGLQRVGDRAGQCLIPEGTAT